jgi:hypothetical protein
VVIPTLSSLANKLSFAVIPGSFPHHRRHGTNSIYSHDSHDSSSSLLADDEESSAGSPDEADHELCYPHYLPNNSQPLDLEAPGPHGLMS